MLGFLIVTTAWIFFILPLITAWTAAQFAHPPEYQNPEYRSNSPSDPGNPKGELNKTVWQKATEDPTAFFTAWVAVFTSILAVSTIALGIVTWLGIRRDARDTEILQRAYISVNALGFRPHDRDPTYAAATVQISNVGKLPARKVHWVVFKTFSRDSQLAVFPIHEARLEGPVTLAPGVNTRKTSPRIPNTRTQKFVRGMGNRDRFLYVWGIVRYEDGFGNQRFTEFCQRYNLAAMTAENRISADDARLHEYGPNDAD